MAALIGDDDRMGGRRDVEDAADDTAGAAVQADEGADRGQEDDYDGIAESGQDELHLRLSATLGLNVSGVRCCARNAGTGDAHEHGRHQRRLRQEVSPPGHSYALRSHTSL